MRLAHYLQLCAELRAISGDGGGVGGADKDFRRRHDEARTLLERHAPADRDVAKYVDHVLALLDEPHDGRRASARAASKLNAVTPAAASVPLQEAGAKRAPDVKAGGVGVARARPARRRPPTGRTPPPIRPQPRRRPS